MTMMINLTPHAISIKTSKATVDIEPSGKIARVINTQILDRIENEIPIMKNSFSHVENLPSEQQKKLFIVSGMVRRFLSVYLGADSRKDVVCPDTEIGCIKQGTKILSVSRLLSS